MTRRPEAAAGDPMPEIGTKIPALTGRTGENIDLTLSSLRGRWVVIYFYPKDNTPGCTTEAQQFRDLHMQFHKRNAQVIGVSRDSVRSHANFALKQDLPFSLISDADETWCRAFDVIQEKTLYGKKHMGVVRSTFLIDPEGRLAAEWRGVKVPGHAQAVLDAIPAR
jgi:peroxiredoxin Q/BCP